MAGEITVALRRSLSRPGQPLEAMEAFRLPLGR